MAGAKFGAAGCLIVAFTYNRRDTIELAIKFTKQIRQISKQVIVTVVTVDTACLSQNPLHQFPRSKSATS